MKELKDLEDRIGNAAQDTIQAYEAVICAIKGLFGCAFTFLWKDKSNIIISLIL